MATWLFYTPRGAVTRVMLDGSPAAPGINPRQLTVTQLLRGAGVPTAADHALAGEVFAVADFASEADGTVQVVRRFDQHDNGGMKPTLRPRLFDNQPWGARAGTVALSDADLAALPYFQGG